MYIIDSDQLAKLHKIETFLYQDSALSPGFIDRKRDMANLLNELLRQIERDKVE